MRLAAIAPLLLFAAQSVPAALQQQDNNGTIEGVVLRNSTNEPVSNAQVSLQEIRTPPAAATAIGPGGFTAVGGGGGVLGGVVAGGTITGGTVVILEGQAVAPPPPTAGPPLNPVNQAAPSLTDSNGKFSFTNLDAGTYRIIVTANGYARQEHGQRVPNGMGVPVYLGANENLRDLRIHLTPTGVVSGRIFDDQAQPALGAPVQLLRV